MPIIRVARVDGATESVDPAAAAMALTLAQASAPIPQPSAHSKFTKTEKTLPDNPNKLVVDQHVFPLQSMKQFVGTSGRVSVFEIPLNKDRLVTPKNVMFCAQRAWDQQTEAFYMKRIEDRFQKTVHPILKGHVSTIVPGEKRAIDWMFALWYMRSRYRRLDAQETQLNGIPGSELTKAQEECLEKNGYLFARLGGKMPTRHLNGIQLHMRIRHYVRDLAAAISGWGVVQAQSGEFIVPDIPTAAVIPLSPKLALAACWLDGLITEQKVAEINSALKISSQDYYFARDLKKCPFEPANGPSV